jgi:acyl carrier protein
MELNDFLNLFKEQYIDGESIELSATDNFRDIDSYDSLTGMAILVMIKDTFDVSLSDDEFKSLHTVSEVFDHIQTSNK